MGYHKLILNKSYFCLWFLHSEVMKLVCLMNIELLHVFPVVLCFCRCIVVTGFDLGCHLALVFLWPLWSLKLFRMAKEPFQKRSLELNSYIHVVVRDCDNFPIACYVLTTGPKANQNPSFTWYSDLWVTANQIIFHTFWEKSHGLHTWLAMVNHRCPFCNFFWGEGAAVHRL